MQTQNLTIRFHRKITFSTNNISIYQISNSNSSLSSSSTATSMKIDTLSSLSSDYLILKQSVEGKSTYCSVSDDGKGVIVKMLDSTFDNVGTNYTVVMDDGFVKDQELDEPIVGIKKNLWNFKTGKNFFIEHECLSGQINNNDNDYK